MPPDQRRAHLCDAITHLIARHGYSAITHGNVARQANVSKGLVQHVFPTRESMFVETFRFVRERLEHRIQARLAIAHESPSASILRELLVAMVPETEEDIRYSLVGSDAFVRELPEGDARHVFAQGQSEIESALQDMIAAAYPNADARIVSFTALALVQGVATSLVLERISYDDAITIIDSWLASLA